MLLVHSGKFSNEHCCAKESLSESTSTWGIGCHGALGAVPFVALILLLHTSAESGLLLYYVVHWFQDRFLICVHSLVYSLYSVCTCSRLAGDIYIQYSYSLVL